MGEERRKEHALAALLDDPARARSTLRTLLNTSGDAVVVLDPDERICGANEATGRFFGLDEAGLVGTSLQEMLERIATLTDDEPRLWTAVERIRGDADLSPSIPSDADPVMAMSFHLARPRPMDLRLSAAPLDDAVGARLGAIWTFRDVTELARRDALREQAEEALGAAQGQLVQSEKMATLGMLVAGIAHEINTPIGAVSSMHHTLVLALDKVRDLLKEQFGGGVEENAKLEKAFAVIADANRVIHDGSSRVTNIVKRLRSFARLDESELEDADLNEGIEDTLTLIQHELKHDITVVRDLGELPPIACYPGRLNQVFLNILMNARQAIEGKGRIKVVTRLEGKAVRVEISDTGVGIPPENASRIFAPGFTTKGAGVGTGLGLSICHQIVQEHRGRISVESNVGKGTTFTIEIPSNLKELVGPP